MYDNVTTEDQPEEFGTNSRKRVTAGSAHI